MRVKTYFACCLLFLLAIPLAVSSAGRTSVVVVISEDIAPFRQIAQSFSAAIKQSLPAVTVEEYLLDDQGSALAKIKAANADLILSIGTYATETVLQELPGTPVVFAGIVQPEDSPVIKKSGIAGVSLDTPLAMQLQYLKKINPALRTVGIIYHPAENESAIKKAEPIIAENGLALKAFPVNSVVDINNIKRLNVDALLFIPDYVVCQPKTLKKLIVMTIQQGILTVGISAEYARAGTFIAFSPDYADTGFQSAQIAVRILKGEQPSAVGIAAPQKIDYFINKVVANRLGMAISGDILSKSKEVFGQ